MEVGEERIIIDGGPNDNFKNYLEKWQYSYLIEADNPVYISKLFVSHFDADHYEGLLDLINNPSFTFGTIYHNGIARFDKKDKRPVIYNKDLEVVENKNLLTTFDTLDDLTKLKEHGGFQYTFGLFYKAIKSANEQGRLKRIKCLIDEKTIRTKKVNGKRFKINVLGPVMTEHNGAEPFVWFKDSSHTRNGHSAVLKVEYGDCSILLDGDLNTHAEKHLVVG